MDIYAIVLIDAEWKYIIQIKFVLKKDLAHPARRLQLWFRLHRGAEQAARFKNNNGEQFAFKYIQKRLKRTQESLAIREKQQC